ILANNSIVLTQDSFAKFCCITVIHLEGNNLQTIPDKAFNNQTRLRNLLLQRNELVSLPPCLFCGLKQLRWLFLHHNKLQFMNMHTWRDLVKLKWLELMHNQITLEHESFPFLPSLKMLNLAHNNIQTIRNDTFSELSQLSELDLRHNLVQYIQANAFHKLWNLDYLDLSHNCLHILDEKVFSYLQSLDKLMLGHNPLQKVPGKLFDPLGNLSSLDLQDIEIEHIDTTMFQMMGKLDFVYFKQYYYCTYAPNVPKCSPNSDGLSSFENLLSKPIQRITVWLVATFTCIANILVILGRFTARDENQALSFVVRNLAVSDLLMGVYLVMIAYKDLSYRGSYNNHAHQWMSSVACTLSGIAAMVSSEVSVLILAFLSLERFLLIAVPFSGHQKLNMSTATYSLATIWAVGIIVAVAPVLHGKNSTRFYGTNGMCFPLHIDIPFLMGWQYSAFVFLGVNTTVMVLMVIVYSAMFHSIVKTRTATTISLGDSEFAVRFFLIVLTDALCWAPITVIKILALCRVHIPGSLYAWVVVFVLPVNSAINPLLYTFTTPKYCKIIKNLGGIITRRSLYSSRKHLSADTESSMVSNKRNAVCLSSVERKSSGERKESDSTVKQLQTSKLETYAEETL
ncbi:relaxin receptor 1-like, partial [Macrosteles quadrilineatus]|uniref:relaxin receptor 1-like n=1 Tax=Macrosteles quadrilineatus TaxID=74068 RepID=UPI0023E1BF58